MYHLDNRYGFRHLFHYYYYYFEQRVYKNVHPTIPVVDDRPDYEQAHAAIHCSRCHINSAEHLRQEDYDLRVLQRWSELSPLESVNRCGECHRRADHFPEDELNPDNELLVRFASVSLSLSECFQNQSSNQRLDCLTCHNPHRPAETSWKYYYQKCVKCHTNSAKSASTCSSPETSQQCLSCHMPKKDVSESLQFTDHWIRVHE